MSVDVPVGGAMISTSAGVAYYVWNSATDNVSVSTSSPSNPRKDILVAYVNLAAISSASADNPSAFSFMVVAGTPAASPADPSDSTIQAAVGSGNPYIKLRRIAVATSATTIVNANMTDISSPMALAMPYLYGGSSNTKGHLVPNQADAFVALTSRSDGKLDYASLLATIFSSQVLTQVNAGTAGGTMNYVNLGGIKLLWITTGNLSANLTTTSYTFTLPTSFFTTVTAVLGTAANMSLEPKIYVSVASANTTTVTTYLIDAAGTASATSAISLLVIGT